MKENGSLIGFVLRGLFASAEMELRGGKTLLSDWTKFEFDSCRREWAARSRRRRSNGEIRLPDEATYK